jgi:hypothetical protein
LRQAICQFGSRFGSSEAQKRRKGGTRLAGPKKEEGGDTTPPLPSRAFPDKTSGEAVPYFPVTATVLLYPTGRVMPEKVYGPNLARSVALPLVTFHVKE